MSQPLQTIRRVTVYADAALERELIDAFMQLGSNGYSITECRGKGEHELVEDPFLGLSRIRIELIVQPAVAEKIIQHLSIDAYRSYALAACMETVQVAANERF